MFATVYNQELTKGTEKRATKNVQIVMQHCAQQVE